MPTNEQIRALVLKSQQTDSEGAVAELLALFPDPKCKNVPWPTEPGEYITNLGSRVWYTADDSVVCDHGGYLDKQDHVETFTGPLTVIEPEVREPEKQPQAASIIDKLREIADEMERTGVNFDEWLDGINAERQEVT